ncbi:MAG TPA: tannase/feruloyl esterase family alpha/beta hydrolase, partial [Terriglobales bacterium]|nr:tannase/feruloyl esterase family alpha/beta hydrolase [Terriglobales bacterium]
MKMRWLQAGALVLCLFTVACAAQSQSSSCEKLKGLALKDAQITRAETVNPGAANLVDSVPPTMAALFKSLPAFCRVSVEAHPSSDSDIKIEVWMPATGWNGKFQAQGNGGFAGQIDYRGMATALSHGYATAGTDTGHSGTATDATWALGHPEKIVDFGYRAIHVMTEIAKQTISAFYQSKPKHSYFGSCSNGGREALMEAQRYSEDYDGILAGAPANYWSHLLVGALWDAQATTLDPASYIPSSKLPAIAAAVNSACDAQDGVKDGVLNDPRQCHFDPAVLTCKTEDRGEDKAECLTPLQVTALKKLYQGAHDSHGQIFPGFLPGAETGEGGWSVWITGAAPGHALLFAFARGYFGNMIYDKADWGYKTADLSDATKASDEKGAKILNATDPDLSHFKNRGGKLIIYHGWDDPAISALNTIDYFHQVQSKMGTQNVESFLRVYTVPGMQHCGGGPGATSFEEGLHARQDAEHN